MDVRSSYEHSVTRALWYAKPQASHSCWHLAIPYS